MVYGGFPPEFTPYTVVADAYIGHRTAIRNDGLWPNSKSHEVCGHRPLRIHSSPGENNQLWRSRRPVLPSAAPFSLALSCGPSRTPAPTGCGAFGRVTRPLRVHSASADERGSSLRSPIADCLFPIALHFPLSTVNCQLPPVRPCSVQLRYFVTTVPGPRTRSSSASMSAAGAQAVPRRHFVSSK